MDPFTAAILGSTAIQTAGGFLGGRATSRAGRAALETAALDGARARRESRRLLGPYQSAGNEAIGQLRQIYGGSELDVSPFIDSPQYRFLQQEGENALLRQKSAMGRLASGETQRDLTAFGQGLASTQFDNYVNRLFGLAGIGQNAVGQQLNTYLGAGSQTNQMAGLNAGFQADAAQSIFGNAGSAANSAIQNMLFADLLKQGGTSSFNNTAPNAITQVRTGSIF